ncbi:MAG: hypothetical protein V4805_13090 [Pseudomonadota bacterium]
MKILEGSKELFYPAEPCFLNQNIKTITLFNCTEADVNWRTACAQSILLELHVLAAEAQYTPALDYNLACWFFPIQSY